uniref:Cystatin domain-containing protein n=1 Tax=Paramormyrops kingsleyae TaxID=1676925 RepID=A0A3B3S945_9TELE
MGCLTLLLLVILNVRGIPCVLPLLETLPLAGHKHRPVPGSSHNISKNDPGVQNAVLVSTYTFNNESNDIFFFRVYAIKVAQIQIVKGIKYVLEVTISRTICRKSMSPPSLDKCPFQPEGALQQMFNCHFEVWAIPWKHWSKVTSFVCHPPSRLLPTGSEVARR